jgi:hypothetical protein
MEIKVKYPYLMKLLVGVLQTALALYLIYHLNFLNLLGYSIILISLENIKKLIK